MTMTLLISMLIGTSVLYIFFLQIRESNELNRTKFRFRYFALRDQLAMLVATGKIKEDSWEYKNIIQTLNFHINSVESLSFLRVVEVIAKYHLSSKEERQVRQLSKKVDNKEVAKILFCYLETTSDLIRRNSRLQILLVRVIGRFLRIMKMKNSSADATMPDRALSKIKSHKAELELTLSAA